jgi:hypothetical protein
MPFAVRNLSVLAYAQGFTLWHYLANLPMLGSTLVPPATAAEVSELGFFNPASDMLAQGDMVLVSTREAGLLLFVTGTEGGVRTAILGGGAPMAEGEAPARAAARLGAPEAAVAAIEAAAVSARVTTASMLRKVADAHQQAAVVFADAADVIDADV